MPPKAIVLDIEGTVSSISFVKDKLYPFALEKLREVLPSVNFPPEKGRSELDSYLIEFPEEYRQSSTSLYSHVQDLTLQDIKAPYWKSLQGYLWKSGYELGQLKADLFTDAASAIPRWSRLLSQTGSKGIFIYSSGSIPAQKLLFGHTEAGDITSQLSGYFDTTTAGPKTDSASYNKISAAIAVPGKDILFFSDNTKEIDAASDAGWKTVWVQRPGNAEAPGYVAPHKTATEFTNELLE